MKLKDTEHCLHLATYLYNFINSELAKEAEEDSSLENLIIIREVYNYDKYGIPLSQMPVLKVFRNTDNYRFGTTIKTTNASVTYNVAYPDLDEMPTILTWMSERINLGLLQYNREYPRLAHNNVDPYVGEHLLFQDSQQGIVSAYLRFNINFKDCPV